MKSPLTRTAAVIAIVLAVLSFLFPTRHGLVPESVALADVQQAVQAQETVLATGKRTLYFDRKPAFIPPGFEKLFEKNLIAHEDGSYTWTLISETYVSTQGYANLVYTEDGQLLGHACADSQGVATFMFPPARMYTRFELSEAYQDAMAGFTIQGFIRMLYQSGDYRRIGPKPVDGANAVGFEVTDWRQRMPEALNGPIASFLLNMGDVTARAWIDPETKLPIRTEAEGDLAPCVVSLFQEARLVIVDDTFKWGIEINDTMFLPDIPEDYRQIQGVPPSAVAASSAALVTVGPWYVLLLSRRRRCVGSQRPSPSADTERPIAS